MAIHCEDIDTLVHPYLDGELDEHDLGDFEEHIAECAGCRRHTDAEQSFVDGLRQHMAPPAPPSELRARIVAHLDDEDRALASAARRARFGWVLPGAATVAAAAALVVFVFDLQQPSPDQPVAYEAVRQHMRRPPVEVQGAAVTPWIKEHFRPRVALPRFAEPTVRLRGARLSHLRGRDAAQLFYEVERAGAPRHELQVHIVEAADLDLSARHRRRVAGHDLWVDARLGYSTVTFKDGDLGYVFTSDMEAEELVGLVVGSDLPLRLNQRFQGR